MRLSLNVNPHPSVLVVRMYNVGIHYKSLHEKVIMTTNCKICKKEFTKKESRQKNCSLSCAAKNKWINYKRYSEFSDLEKIEYMKKFYDQKVIRKNGCWSWSACIDDTGYGVMALVSKKINAHRVSWMIHNQKIIPKGKWVLHKCDNPICSNPEHIYLGNAAQNSKDMIERGRSNIPLGEKRSHTKLKNHEAKEIKQKLLEGIHEKELSKQFKVHVNTIRDIKMNRRWRHI